MVYKTDTFLLRNAVGKSIGQMINLEWFQFVKILSIVVAAVWLVPLGQTTF